MKIIKQGYLGFSLVELLFTVVILSILAAVAMPSYTSYINKQRMRSAQLDLAGMLPHIENHFQRTLIYPEKTTSTQATQTALPKWSPSETAYFTFIISESSSQGYQVQATGTGAFSGCTISLSSTNVRSTSGCPYGAGKWL